MTEFKVGNKIQVKSNIHYQGWDLSYQKGIIRNINSYLEIYLPDLELDVKLLRYEVTLGDPFDEFDYVDDN